MAEPVSTTTVSITMATVLHEVLSKPVGETLLIMSVGTILLFLLISSIAFVVSRIRGDVKVSLFSFLKIGKGRRPREDEGLEDKQDINITINNSATAKQDDVRKENDLLNELTRLESQEEDINPVELEPEYMGSSDNDILVIISKSVRFGSEMAKYKEVYLIKSQMSAAEIRTDIIEGLLIKEYMELVYKKKGPATNIQEDQSYRIFSEIIHHQTHRQILAVLRKIFKDNHLVRYTDEKYAEYMNAQCERMMMSIRLSINNSIPTFLDPGREAVNDIIDNNSRCIIETFQDIFIEARALAFKTEVIVKRKEKEFDEEIKRLTGIHNAHMRADIQSEDPFGEGACADRS